MNINVNVARITGARGTGPALRASPTARKEQKKPRTCGLGSCAHMTTRALATALAAVLGCVVDPGAAGGVWLGFLRVRVRVRVLGLGLANPNPNTLTRP